MMKAKNVVVFGPQTVRFTFLGLGVWHRKMIHFYDIL